MSFFTDVIHFVSVSLSQFTTVYFFLPRDQNRLVGPLDAGACVLEQGPDEALIYRPLQPRRRVN